MGIADTTGTQLTAHQICFKEYIKYLKYNGDSGYDGDRTYSITYTTTTTTNNNNNNNNIILLLLLVVVVVYVIYLSI